MFEELPPLDLEDEPVDEGSIAKEALKAEVAGGLTAGSCPDRAVVGEILLALEAQNPTRSPATSPLLNGKWKFVYASGASPGLKALQLLLKGSKSAPKSPSGADIVDVEESFLTITPEQPRATSAVRVRLLSFENTVKLSCRLEAESAVRLTETYDAAESEYMSIRLPFQSPVQYKRSLLVSYLDDELLVVRDALGRPDVLMRCDQVAWGSSSLDGDATNGNDDNMPGAS
uniref:Plastid lipid-associated protein/fibrillin conserved domain-containing protein n=1 Tax=Haptolina ericina TaxID=156174 RepID=A0A7S3C1Z9_9EUKA